MASAIIGISVFAFMVWMMLLPKDLFWRVWSTTLTSLALLIYASLRQESAIATVTYSMLALLNFVICLALSPAQVLFFRFNTRRKHTAPIEVIPSVSQNATDEVKPTLPVLVDIVAVHGLGSNADTAWAYPHQNLEPNNSGRIQDSTKAIGPMWLRDFLPHATLPARILVYYHNTNWRSNALNMSLRGYGNDLLLALESVRQSEEERTRPIIFIGFSYGGIIIKQALQMAPIFGKPGWDLPREFIPDSAKGFVFIGTPHLGSKMTIHGRILSLFGYWQGSSTSLLQVVEPGSIENQILHEAFISRYDKNLMVNFYEVCPEYFGPFSLLETVAEESATIQGVLSVESFNKHRDMHRFNSENDDGYKKLLTQIKRIVMLVAKPRLDELSEQQGIVTEQVEDEEEPSSAEHALRPIYSNALQNAALANDAALVEALLVKGADVNTFTGDYGTSLQAAAARGNDEVVQLLLKHGANVNIQGGRYDNALKAALTVPHITTAWILLKARMDFKVHLCSGPACTNVLHLSLQRAALFEMSMAFIESIGSFGVKKQAALDATDKEHGKIPLHWAAERGEMRHVQLLLDYGSNIEAIDKNGCTPLNYAVRFNRDRVVAVLVRRGANVEATRNKVPRPLSRASRLGNLEKVKLLLGAGADVRARDEHGRTPLHWAAELGHIKVVTALTQAGSVLNSLDVHGKTPLHWAAERGHCEVVQALLKAGSDVTSKDKYGETPLHYAIEKGQIEAVKLLVKAGSPLDALDEKKRAPLDCAPKNVSVAIANILSPPVSIS